MSNYQALVRHITHNVELIGVRSVTTTILPAEVQLYCHDCMQTILRVQDEPTSTRQMNPAPKSGVQGGKAKK